MGRLRWLLAGALLAGCGGAHPRPAPVPPVPPRPSRTPAPRTDPAAVAARARIPVLAYHQIRDATPADSAQDRQYIVSPRAFAAQMKALDDAGYAAVGADALVAHAARASRLPRRAVLITLDDGSAGQYTRALPMLRRHRFTATFFPMTVVLGKPGWMTRAQVRALDRAGMTIGAHTWDHHAVPGYSGDDWRVQLEQPKAELETLLGHRVRVFAYPFGLWNPSGFAHLKAAGYTAAFQLSDKLDRSAPLWTLRRIIVPEWTGTRLLQEMRRDF
jgi:peptidoglycan/xylan/chitin deacetylase (PgdA/CDA1 family)